MSLASFLLTKAVIQDAQVVDTELDELFQSKAYTATPVVEANVRNSKNVAGKKRKLNEKEAERTATTIKKTRNESKSKESTDDEGSSEDSGGQEDGISTDSEAVEEEKEEESRSGNDSEETSIEEGSSSTLEQSSEDDVAGGSHKPSNIVHESLTSKKKLEKDQKRCSNKKYVPPEETPAQRDLRTIFVGNLSAEVAKKRPLQKQLRRHLLSAVPTAKLESIRFRSIAFHSPTSGPLTTDSKDGREHDRVRAAAWREGKEDIDEKKFLTPHQKKKIAFINQEFHSIADTVHAYAVFAHPIPFPLAAPEHQSRKEVKDPYEAAQIAAKHCDGTIFMDRLLRVDVAGKSSAAYTDAEPKLTIFVGNLDFASKEEDLRIFFESIISEERGGPPPSPLQVQESEDENEDASGCGVKKARTWVTRIRIVRDRETQLGKGFAYVQFADRECVDEILALEEGKLKFAKRKLRVQRCKTIPGSSASTRHFTADTGNKSTKKASSSRSKHQNTTRKPSNQGRQAVKPATPIVVPKGNPKLGEALANLPKEERKKAKAANADRVARRLAKKRARMAMGVKDKDQANEGKKRVRVRNNIKDKGNKSGRTDKGKEKKVRGRSEKSLAKLNTKK